MRSKRVLGVDGGGNRIAGADEGDKERVSLRIDDAAMPFFKDIL